MEMMKMARICHTMMKAAAAINDVDPDDGNKWKCDACRLPIFATRFVDDPNGHMHLRSASTGHLHDQCANKIPARLEEHPLHPMADLILQHVQPDDINTHEYYCSRCKWQCGSKFYKCGDRRCDFTLDLLCASPISIAHQSHGHELTAFRGASCSFICSTCGTQHDQPPLGRWDVSYVCIPCDFWIHPDCAVLPYAIEIVDNKVHVHDHPLLLSYGNRALEEMFDFFIKISYECAICGGDSKGSGWYRCFHCNFAAHIKCVVYSDPPRSFKPVLLRDAKVPGMIHLPMANEHQSVIQRLMNSTGTSSRINGDNDECDYSKVHQHPLVINRRNNDDDDDDARVCNACVQLISPSDAFYSCSKVNNNNSCRDFFLHSCCAQLPEAITIRRCSYNYKEHTISLVSEVGKYPFYELDDRFNLFSRLLHNGFVYFCKVCRKYQDVTAALMPTSITHAAHAKSHILCITSRMDLTCSCCKRDGRYTSQIGYKCNNCNNFFIHVECALLPDKVTHDFDQHSLNLITTNHQQRGEEEVPFCEICEQDMDDTTGRWFYGCKKCDQSFHVNCIPYFDHLSGIKFGFTIIVTGHGCPLVCVRALSVEGYRCAHCHVVIIGSTSEFIRESGNLITGQIAFECEECDYRIHERCGKKLLLKG